MPSHRPQVPRNHAPCTLAGFGRSIQVCPCPSDQHSKNQFLEEEVNTVAHVPCPEHTESLHRGQCDSPLLRLVKPFCLFIEMLPLGRRIILICECFRIIRVRLSILVRNGIRKAMGSHTQASARITFTKNGEQYLAFSGCHNCISRTNSSLSIQLKDG